MYRKTLYIQPVTLTDLTVNIIHDSEITRTATLEDCTIYEDRLKLGITYFDSSDDTVEISSTGYETQTILVDEIPSVIILQPLEFSNIEKNSIKYYCKDETARNSITDINTALDTKLNTADVWYDSTTSTLNIGVAQV